MVLRIAMLMALSRGHLRHIEAVDVEFAIGLIKEVAERIDKVVVPPSVEGAVAAKILTLLPCTDVDLYNSLGDRYGGRRVFEALDLLRKSNRIWTNNKTGNIEVTPDQTNR
jgi:hypothetical protein